MTPIKISISGKMKSGKDTFAEIAKECIYRDLLCKEKVEIIHIAQSVYEVTEFLIGYRLFGKKIVKKTPFERKALQVVGNWGRKIFGKDLWLNQAVKKLKNKTNDVLVTGVRYPNEVHALNKIGFYSVWIDCPEKLRKQRGANNMNDSTETAFDSVDKKEFFDRVIYNNNSLEAFEMQVCDVIDRIDSI